MRFLLQWAFPERQGLEYAEYAREQAWTVRQVLVWGALLEVLAWVPYFFTDPLLHPELSERLFWLRLLLPATGMLLLIGTLTPVLSRYPMFWAHLGLFVPLQVTPLITNLTGMDPRYVSGYVLVLLVMVLFPVPFFQTALQVSLSYIQFLVGAMLLVPDVFATGKRYSFTDLTVAYAITIVMLYVTERLRLKAYTRKHRLEEISQDLSERNDQMQLSLSMAREVQANLLPTEFPETEVFEVDGSYRSMEQVGGDFFAIRGPHAFGDPPGPGRYAFFVADACGHGVSAALISAMAQLAFDSALARGLSSPARILDAVNRDLLPYLLAEHYLTAFAMVLDERDGSVRYANAGHRPVIAIRADGQAALLNTDGLILGMFEEGGYEESSLRVSPGDTFLFYTDGIVEARNLAGVEYGTERLVHSLRQFRQADAGALLAAVEQDALRFSEGVDLRDDVTLMLLRIKGDPVSGNGPPTMNTAPLSG